MPASTRERISDAAGELFMRQGYHATGVKQIVNAAGAPFASLYHFFPGGKEELGVETLTKRGAEYLAIVAAVWDSETDVVRSVHAVFQGAAQLLVDTDYADACPIATVALEVASVNEPLRLASSEVFESWIVWAASRLQDAGVTRVRARELAIAIVALLEGAFLLARAAKTTAPLAATGKAAVALVRAALSR